METMKNLSWEQQDDIYTAEKIGGWSLDQTRMDFDKKSVLTIMSDDVGYCRIVRMSENKEKELLIVTPSMKVDHWENGRELYSELLSGKFSNREYVC